MSTTGTVTLADFLLARIAEDEAVARAATPGPWKWADDAEPWLETVAERYHPEWAWTGPDIVISAYGMHTEGWVDCEPNNRDHIARFDPARVLAECAVKRGVVERWRSNQAASDLEPRSSGHSMRAAAELLEVLRLLATIYADHPDYREEWRP